MPFKKTFAERERERRREVPDVLTYDLPEKLRNQIILIWRNLVGGYAGRPTTREQHQRNAIWTLIERKGCAALGVLELGRKNDNPDDALETALLLESPENALSLVEVVFDHLGLLETRKQRVDDAIGDMNSRFRQYAVGYQYESGEIIRLDTTYTHDAMVKPALLLLSQKGFGGANQEFLKAHEHYRHGRNKEAVNEALKAFESTMKCICDQRKIEYGKTDTARALITLMFDSGVLPSSLESHMNGFRAALEGGLPTVRNKGAGHGQGAEVVAMPEQWARHALHLAAANIVLLVDSHLAEAA